MPDFVLQVPFSFQVQVVRKRCRNAERLLVRDVMPVTIPEISVAEAPLSLRAALSEAGRERFAIRLRHDGTSYLRAMEVVGQAGAKEPFRRTDLERLVALQTRNPSNKLDVPRSWLTRDNHSLLKTPSDVRKPDWPTAMETYDRLAPTVREWIADGSEAARRAVAYDAASYVLVDGALHRRTSAPMLDFGTPGYWSATQDGSHVRNCDPHAGLSDGAVFDEVCAGRSSYGNEWFWWPLSMAEDFAAMIPERECRIEVEGAIRTDPARDIARIGFVALRRMDRTLSAAVRHLSAEGLGLYRDYRVARDRAGPEGADPGAVLEAMEIARRMAADPGYGSRARELDAFDAVCRMEFVHWDRMLTGMGYGIDERDEGAMTELAAMEPAGGP